MTATVDRVRKIMLHGSAGAMLAALGACGGSDGSGSAPPPVTQAPPPVPTPPPPVTPTPQPTPQVPSPGPALGGARIGQLLETQVACSNAPTVRTGSGLVSGIGLAPAIDSDRGLVIRYAAVDTFNAEFDLGSSTYGPPQMLTGTSARFLGPAGAQLEFVRNDVFSAPSATLGFLTFGSSPAAEGLCFIAAGLPAAALFASAPRYNGWADGLAQIGGTNRRLFGSESTVTVGPAGPFNETATLRVSLSGLSDAFGEPGGQQGAPIGEGVADLIFDGDGRVPATPLTGIAGFSGTVRGHSVGASGLVFSFELRNSVGELIWGAIAVDSARNPV